MDKFYTTTHESMVDDLLEFIALMADRCMRKAALVLLNVKTYVLHDELLRNLKSPLYKEQFYDFDLDGCDFLSVSPVIETYRRILVDFVNRWGVNNNGDDEIKLNLYRAVILLSDDSMVEHACKMILDCKESRRPFTKYEMEQQDSSRKMRYWVIASYLQRVVDVFTDAEKYADDEKEQKDW